MTFFCVLFGHLWMDALDPATQQCSRCPKMRPRPRVVPDGAKWCPYPGCAGWTPIPNPSFESSDGERVLIATHTTCFACKQKVRWTHVYEPTRYGPIWHYRWDGPKVEAS